MQYSENQNSATEALAQELKSVERFGLRRLFTDAGAPEPLLVWSPEPKSIYHPVVRKFLHLIEPMCREDSTVNVNLMTLEPFGSMKDFMMVLDVEDNGTTFRYRHYGNQIGSDSGTDRTGMTTANFPGHVSVFFTALYRAALVRKERLLIVHESPLHLLGYAWRRVVVPVTDDSGDVVAFFAINLPENEFRSGLEIMPFPVMIVNADLIVCFANRHAREAFDAGRQGPWNRNLFEYSGIDLNIKLSPEALLKVGKVHETLSLQVQRNIIARYEISISAMSYRDHAYFVVIPRKMKQ
ncbi:MAG: hypothetical protein ACJAQW_002041 [Paracoccaceae bacterium]|jgi:hypothetical protein